MKTNVYHLMVPLFDEKDSLVSPCCSGSAVLFNKFRYIAVIVKS
jgi:hypothetical protein